MTVICAPRRHHGRGEADLALADQDPAAGGNEHEEERPEQLGKQPPPLKARIVKVLAIPELQHQQVMCARRNRPDSRHEI